MPSLERILDDRTWVTVVLTVVAVHVIHFVIEVVKTFSVKHIKTRFFQMLRKIPAVQRKIDEEIEKVVSNLEKKSNNEVNGKKYFCKLPDAGWTKDDVLKEIDECMSLGKFKAEDGALTGTCHKQPDDNRVKVVTEAFARTAFANPLNPDAFPGIRKMEAEVVRMVANLFHADPNAYGGTMTSGGTESLILACKAYRDYAKKTRGVTKPNIVMPITAHVGFEKACHLLGMTAKQIWIDPVTMKPDLKKFTAAIDDNTCMLVASAPQYPHGLMDPISSIAKIARSKNLPLHVDACLGGFLIAFAEKAGRKITEPFDFREDGITSISADTHKFGYAPKGSSVILYREKKFVHCQYFVSPDWTGGIFASPTMAGSRSGGLIAATWAAMMNFGLDGYVEASKAIFNTLQFIVDEVRKIDELQIVGDPQVCIVAFTSNHFSIYSLADEMAKKGWLLASLQNPPCVHLYITPMHTQAGIKEKFVASLRQVCSELRENPAPAKDGSAAIYGMAQSLPDKGIVHELAERFIDSLYTTK